MYIFTLLVNISALVVLIIGKYIDATSGRIIGGLGPVFAALLIGIVGLILSLVSIFFADYSPLQKLIVALPLLLVAVIFFVFD